MKKFYSPIASFCLAFTALLTVSQAEVSPVRIRVETANKVDVDKTTTTQSRGLNVIVDNSSAEALELKVKYAIFGRDVTSKDIVTMGQGEVPTTVKPHGSEKVPTPPVKASVNEPKAAKGQKKPDPTGQKIVGHGVQVLKGDTVVAELYEPASMKESFGKAAAATPAAPAAPKK